MRNIINMRKSLLMVTSLAALTAGGVSVAQAGPAAHTVPDPPCELLDGNGGIALTSGVKITATGNSNGNATFQCKAEVTPADSGDAVHWDSTSAGLLFNWPDGVPCNVPVADPTTGLSYTPTLHWEETVSASGNATFTCHLP